MTPNFHHSYIVSQVISDLVSSRKIGFKQTKPWFYYPYMYAHVHTVIFGLCILKFLLAYVTLVMALIFLLCAHDWCKKKDANKINKGHHLHVAQKTKFGISFACFKLLWN